jgi:hypothetical protein
MTRRRQEQLEGCAFPVAVFAITLGVVIVVQLLNR